MLDRWLADRLFPQLPKNVRRRKARLLIIGVVLAVLAAAAIGAGLYFLNKTGRFS